MIIVHAVHQIAHGPLSFDDVVTGTRGVTGSEQAMLFLAKAQAEAGHRVFCYLPCDKPGLSNGIEFLDIRTAWPRLRRMDQADVVIAWLSADPLRNANPHSLRIHSLQINDWLMCGPNFDAFADVYVSVSQAHKDHLTRQFGSPTDDHKWEIIPNGVDITRFTRNKRRVPYRCVYLSSPDRGLHWLLSIWPEIRFKYPQAELEVFYEVNTWKEAARGLFNEAGIRAEYITKKGVALEHAGVHFRNAVSPQFLAEELATADIMLYPCDTIRFTEGFGVAVLEACAAGVVPFVTDCDAFGEIYQNSGAFIIPRGNDRQWIDRYTETVLQTFANRQLIEDRRGLVRAFAERLDWPIVTKQWGEMIERRMETKKHD